MLDFDNAGVEIGCESEPIDVKQRARGFEWKLILPGSAILKTALTLSIETIGRPSSRSMTCMDASARASTALAAHAAYLILVEDLPVRKQSQRWNYPNGTRHPLRAAGSDHWIFHWCYS